MNASAIRHRQGFALIDALVALTIMATVLAFALKAIGTGRSVSIAAHETELAAIELDRQFALPGQFDRRVSETLGRFQVETSTTLDGPGGQTVRVDLCIRTVRLQSITTRRTFSGSRLVICPETQAL